jgi:hypothetical protein
MRWRDFKQLAHRVSFLLFNAAVLASCAYMLFLLMEYIYEHP